MNLYEEIVSSGLDSEGCPDDISEIRSNYEDDTEDASETEGSKINSKLNFSDLKEQLYRQKLGELKHQLKLLDNGKLPEYVRKLRKIEQTYTEQSSLNEIQRELEIEQIENDYKLEINRAQTEYEDGIFQLRVNLLHEWEERKKNLEMEQNINELTTPTVESKPIATRKLRRRPNDPLPQSDKRRKLTPGQLNLQLDEKQIAQDLKLLNKLTSSGKTKLSNKYSQLSGNTNDNYNFNTYIKDKTLFYDMKPFYYNDKVWIDNKQQTNIPGIIIEINADDILIKKINETTKIRISLSNLENSKYILKKRF